MVRNCQVRTVVLVDATLSVYIDKLFYGNSIIHYKSKLEKFYYFDGHELMKDHMALSWSGEVHLI